MALTDKLAAIGEAIREKTGSAELITLNDMPDKVNDVYSVGHSEGYNKGVGIIANNVSAMWTTNFQNLFANCAELTSIPYINTHNGTNFRAMFYCCYKLQNVPKLVTNNGVDFAHMFCDCQSITTIPRLNFQKGTNFDYMFWGCKSLTELPAIDARNGISYRYMFNACSNLKKIQGIAFGKTADLTGAFDKCEQLEEIEVFGGILYSNISFADSPNLSYKTLTEIKERLHDYSKQSNTHTLTLHKTAFARLTQADIDGIIAKGWSIAV